MRQVNFFMTADDEDVFLDFLFSRHDTHLLSGCCFDSRHPRALLSKEEIGEIAELTLVNKGVMPQPDASSLGQPEPWRKVTGGSMPMVWQMVLKLSRDR
jgi:hypothetical protein